MLLVPVAAVRTAVPDESHPDRVAVTLEPNQEHVLGIQLAAAAPRPLESVLHLVGHVSLPPPARMQASAAGTVETLEHPLGSLGAVRLRAGESILTLSSPGVASTIVRAPMPLVLLSVPQPGQRVDKGNDLYMYTDLSTLIVLADVKSFDIPLIKPGLPAEARLPTFPGVVWRGKAAGSLQQFDERMQTLSVRFEFPNRQTEIWQGMFATIDVHSPARRVLAIPQSAVIADGGGATVFVEKPNHVYEPQPVELGMQADSFVEVKHGLKAGDQVVTSATFLLDSESRLRAAAQAGKGD